MPRGSGIAGESTDVLDAHVHVWGSDELRYPFAPHDRLEPPTQARQLVDFFNDSGRLSVARALLIQPRVYGYDHAFLYQSARTAHGRLRVVPLINVLRPSSIAEIRAHAADPLTAGFRVIALGTQAAEWLDSPPAHTVWAELEALRLPVGFLIDPPQLLLLERIASSHRDLTVVIDHMARLRPEMVPEWSQALRRLAELSNVVVKLSAIGGLSRQDYPYLDMRPLQRLLSLAFDSSRLLWGSDWPHVPAHQGYRDGLMAIREGMTGMTDTEARNIFALTAARVFAFDPVDRPNS